MRRTCHQLLLPTLVALSVALPTSTFAQDTDTTWRWRRSNVIKTNLLAPPSLFYERAFTRRFALRLSARWWPFGITADDTKFANATVEGKFYTAKLARLVVKDHPTGFFINPYLKARTIRYVNEIGQGPGNPVARDEVKAQSIGFGLTVGYIWVFRRGFVLEFQHGGGIQPAALTNFRHTMRYGTVTSESGRDYLQLDFRTGISLGYAF